MYKEVQRDAYGIKAENKVYKHSKNTSGHNEVHKEVITVQHES